jgi:hypothetical protein
MTAPGVVYHADPRGVPCPLGSGPALAPAASTTNN